MFEVTESFILDLGERLRWDGVWLDPPSVPMPRSDPFHGFTEASRALGAPSAYIVVSWELGRLVLNTGSSETFMHTWAPNWEQRFWRQRRPGGRTPEEARLWALGYIGDFNGIPVIASVDAGMQGFVTSVPNPLDLTYADQGIVFFDLSP